MKFNFDKIKDIKSPADIKRMSVEEMQQVADQMRQAVLYRTSLYSGHVGPNLGDVEAIIALHYVFDAPVDKLVLDVSHQDFPHKMITGRANTRNRAKVRSMTSLRWPYLTVHQPLHRSGKGARPERGEI